MIHHFQRATYSTGIASTTMVIIIDYHPWHRRWGRGCIWGRPHLRCFHNQPPPSLTHHCSACAARLPLCSAFNQTQRHLNYVRPTHPLSLMATVDGWTMQFKCFCCRDDWRLMSIFKPFICKNWSESFVSKMIIKMNASLNHQRFGKIFEYAPPHALCRWLLFKM